MDAVDRISSSSTTTIIVEISEKPLIATIMTDSWESCDNEEQ